MGRQPTLGKSGGYSWDEVAQSWRIVDVIRHAWDKETPDFSELFSRETMGPKAAYDLLAGLMALNGFGNQDEW